MSYSSLATAILAVVKDYVVGKDEIDLLDEFSMGAFAPKSRDELIAGAEKNWVEAVDGFVFRRLVVSDPAKPPAVVNETDFKKGGAPIIWGSPHNNAELQAWVDCIEAGKAGKSKSAKKKTAMAGKLGLPDVGAFMYLAYLRIGGATNKERYAMCTGVNEGGEIWYLHPTELTRPALGWAFYNPVISLLGSQDLPENKKGSIYNALCDAGVDPAALIDVDGKGAKVQQFRLMHSIGHWDPVFDGKEQEFEALKKMLRSISNGMAKQGKGKGKYVIPAKDIALYPWVMKVAP